MTTLRFTKGHGTQNDFVLLMDPTGEIDLTPDLVRFLCDRRAGIGADGVIRAITAEHLAAGAAFAPGTWFMDYWNADGSTSEMCGNGARVFAAFIERDARVDLSQGLGIGTRGGPRTVTAVGDGRYAVGMGKFRMADASGAFDAQVAARGLVPERPALFVDMGNPHHVVALGSDDELDGLDLSAAPVVTPPPPAGTNVEFAVARAAQVRDGVARGSVRMRVHERGSGETRSCGTGACAVALAVRSWAGAGAPDVWDVEVPGGLVTVTIDGDTTVLEGPAVLVADGEVTAP
ncbi:diaminopimelate epimerase [Demequina sp.]|uniref:diaminopimelate epimerase n=1 Tax=Demequina sp. TaxID=2050685 RepID=UPI003A887D94